MTPPLPRSEFAVAGRLIYLNHAAVGVLPQSSVAAIDELLQAHAQAGVLGTWPFDERTSEYRGSVARLIGASAEEVAFVASTSAGAAVLAQSMRWNDGDEIVIADDEFPANVVPWLAIRERGVRVRLIDSAGGPLTPDRLRKEIGPNTKAVAVSWVSYADGYRRDIAALAEVAHAAGALIFVDAIQGLGALQVDVRSCDVDAMFSGTGKWLLGVHGAGFLYVRDDLMARLHPGVPGWRAQSDIWDFHNYEQALATGARRLETGTPNLVGNLALHKSAELLVRSDTAAVEAWILQLTDRLCDGLVELGARVITQRTGGVKSGIVTFEMPGVDSRWLGATLQREGIVTTYRDSGIRVAPHGYNLPDEIDSALEAIAQLSASAVAG